MGRGFPYDERPSARSVPLKAAHDAGGWRWSREVRKQYANDLEASEHLVAVWKRLNRQKGAKGPDQWRPPDRSAWCWYAESWLAIKERWGLWMTVPETRALWEMLETCRR